MKAKDLCWKCRFSRYYDEYTLNAQIAKLTLTIRLSTAIL